LYWVALIVNRASGAGEVIDLVNFNIERKGDIVANHFEPRVA